VKTKIAIYVILKEKWFMKKFIRMSLGRQEYGDQRKILRDNESFFKILSKLALIRQSKCTFNQVIFKFFKGFVWFIPLLWDN
jgi:hypothetical protein